ncbi:MAG: hypothetical protein JXA37_00640 [Chloroflexia bacterium]|nr:hypothetical protein [Chloroflexia bacterium]
MQKYPGSGQDAEGGISADAFPAIVSSKLCPSCGRFSGPYEACPYCGARRRGRSSLRLLKIAALVFSLVGLVVLWFASRRVQPPTVRIGQVGGLMNMAYVRIEGYVSQGSDYDPEGESLAFWLADDSGELRVSAYRSEARELIAQGRVPALGDQVAVAGTLRIREDYVALYLNVPEHLEISRPEAQDIEMGAISPLNIGQRVRVRGQVRQVYAPYAGLTLITVRDASGDMAIAVSEALELLTGPLPELKPGQVLEAVGAVSFYRDTPQLVPASTGDLLLTGETALLASRRDLGALSTADVGRWIQVEGAVLESDPFSAGIRFLLDDGSGQLVLLLWQSLYGELPYPQALDVGARLRVQGSLTEYRGALELVPDASADVVVLAAAPPPQGARIAGLGLVDVGRVVQLEGVLVEGAAFSQGLRYVLDDGSGRIVLLLWSNVAAAAPAGLGVGAELRVVGEIAEYKGELEIVPRGGSDLVLLGQSPWSTATPPPRPTAAPTPPPTAPEEPTATPEPTAAPTEPPPATATPAIVLAALAELPNLGGQEVTVEAAVLWAESFSHGFKFLLDDGSGRATLLMWADVYDDCWAAADLLVGATVRAQGTVGQYEGEWQIEPVYGGDVKVVAPGAPPPLRQVAALTTADLSTRVTVEGAVASVEAFSGGQRVHLDDGSGTIPVLLWQNVLERVPDAERLLAPGTAVRVSGVLEEYRGTLELVPQLPYSVIVH